MTAALATLAFLVALWLAVVVTARLLEGRLARIAGALRGNVAGAQLSMAVPVRARYLPRRQRPAALPPRLRAAA